MDGDQAACDELLQEPFLAIVSGHRLRRGEKRGRIKSYVRLLGSEFPSVPDEIGDTHECPNENSTNEWKEKPSAHKRKNRSGEDRNQEEKEQRRGPSGCSS